MCANRPILIALGANLPSRWGPPEATLGEALSQLDARGVKLRARSRWWRTPAFPVGSGPDFVNAAADVACDMSPEQLLAQLHAVEADMGRARPERWAPRVVDLDLIAYGDLIEPDVDTAKRWLDLTTSEAMKRAPDQIILPHPRLHERGFVLAPLADVAPDWRHPFLGVTVRELFEALPVEAMEGIAAIEEAAVSRT
ncbi:MAG: 2-amino-4-hydroxy-6-hydroxymethyldihydropteridine diphosphokinase [Neomegalonema sp.]